MTIGAALKVYVRDLVYGANDGIVTTFAIIASVIGAGLDPIVILIVGFASLVADGLSMAASDYLASRSEQAREGAGREEGRPAIAALVTFLAFVAAGSLPLLPYAILPDTAGIFWWSAAAAAAALLLVGAGRTLATGRPPVRAALEMLIVGGAAVTAAFFIGRYVSSITAGG